MRSCAGVCIYGSNDFESDSTQHSAAGRDSGGCDQPGPNATVWREMYAAGGERSGLRISQFRRIAGWDAHHAERTAGRWKRNRAGGELSSAGKRRQVFSDWRFAVYPWKRMGNCGSSRGLERDDEERSSAGCGEFRRQSGFEGCVEAGRTEAARMAVQSFLARRGSASGTEVVFSFYSRVKTLSHKPQVKYPPYRKNRDKDGAPGKS